jgi:hypothetical protein
MYAPFERQTLERHSYSGGGLFEKQVCFVSFLDIAYNLLVHHVSAGHGGRMV